MKRNIVIDYLKVFLIVFVIIAHYNFTDQQRLNLLFPYYINMAVPAFLVLFGYNMASSFKNKNINSIEEAYNPKMLLQRIIRFIIPFTIIFVLEIVYSILFLDSHYTIQNVVRLFFQGGLGQGSYFTAVIIQITLFFPLIYFSIKKYGWRALVGSFVFVILYEMIKKFYYVGFETYRLLSFQYVFVIAYGVYLHIKNDSSYSKKSIIINILLFLIGGAYIYIVAYLGYKPHIFNHWSDRTVIASLFIIPIITLLIKKLSNYKRGKIISLLSKSTYDIFLVQMIYYHILFTKNIMLCKNNIINIFISILICLVFGIIFHQIESMITKFIIRKGEYYEKK